VVVVQLAVIGVGVKRGVVVVPAVFQFQLLILLAVDILGTPGDGSSSVLPSSTTTLGAESSPS
jgi:hypothetical protein